MCCARSWNCHICGDVEKAIAYLFTVGRLENIEEKNLTNVERYCEVQEDRIASFTKVKFLDETNNFCDQGSNLHIELTIRAKKATKIHLFALLFGVNVVIQ